MKIDIEDFERFLPIFVPAVVTVALSTLEAATLGRSLTRTESNEIAVVVKDACRRYAVQTAKRIENQGGSMPYEEYIDTIEEMNTRIFENAWTLIQRVTDEIAAHISSGA